MAHLQVLGQGVFHARQKAFDDAEKMHKTVQEECQRSGKPAPGYRLTELIGKGSFGRVYKATDQKTADLVAVKIIDVDESDTMNPKLADTYSEFLKEIGALKLLSEGGAQNINYVIEALPVGQSMWMVTEYCAGGSVATLMKPTAPGGLQEKWIIPILREVAVAIFWVHRQGIIHRDIKCANVLITEVGGVQLCDFGVAGMMETKFDKRSTFIGTPHWMAPELFDQNSQYGTEVDIWAFGSMVYEIASGLPPNVKSNVGLPQLGDFLREHIPRLEGPEYSPELKNLVAFCLVENPSHRPPIEQVQQHPYICNTSSRYPTSNLANLVKAYKLWEDRGGSRKSLFGFGGAQGPTELGSTSLAADEWNFSTTLAFDEQVHDDSDGTSEADAVRDVYGTRVDFPEGFNDDTQRPKPKGRRRPPPQVLAAIKAPLEKVFDPNTISNYDENSRNYYSRPNIPPPTAKSDLPLRDDSLQNSAVRESLIDLDASLGGESLESFTDMGTIRAAPAGGPRASMDNNWSFAGAAHQMPQIPPVTVQHAPGPRASMDNSWSFAGATAQPQAPTIAVHGTSGPRASMDNGWSFASAASYERPPLSDPVDMDSARQGGPDWQWPTSIPPATAEDSPSSARPRLIHQATEPIGLPSQGYDSLSVESNDPRMSVTSLIDLDMSMPEPSLPDLTRPSTANSDVASITGFSDMGTGGPFELERHASVYAPVSLTNREPSIYVSDDSEYASAIAKHATGDISDNTYASTDGSSRESMVTAIQDMPESHSQDTIRNGHHGQNNFSSDDNEYLMLTARRGASLSSHPRDLQPPPELTPANAGLALPPVGPPAAHVLEGRAGRDDVADEMRRLIGSLQDHLQILGKEVGGMEPRRAR